MLESLQVNETQKIKNPNYQVKWKALKIDNPDLKDDPEIYVFPSLKYVGIELWQVKFGTMFDNVLICDDPEYTNNLAEETWRKNKDDEKAAFEEAENIEEVEDADKDDADAEDSDAKSKDDDLHDEL